MSNLAVINMQKHLGLPEDSKVSFSHMLGVANIFASIMKSDAQISPISFIYWLEKFGDFTEPKKYNDKIVNQMFMNLKPQDMSGLLPFLEWYQEGCPPDEEED